MHGDEFLKACKELRILEENHAEHVKGWKCGFFPDEDILKYAHGEVSELEDAPDDIHEMADALVCLFSYCVRKKWSIDDVGKAIQFKLRKKFKDTAKHFSGGWQMSKDQPKTLSVQEAVELLSNKNISTHELAAALLALPDQQLKNENHTEIWSGPLAEGIQVGLNIY